MPLRQAGQLFITLAVKLPVAHFEPLAIPNLPSFSNGPAACKLLFSAVLLMTDGCGSPTT